MAETERMSHKVYEKNKIGEVQIADEFVAIIAGLAATEVEGVDSMAGNITNELVGKLGMKPERILFIGDQVFTDIWGANRAGMHTVLTEPVDPSTDEIQIVVKRWFEKPFRHKRT